MFNDSDLEFALCNALNVSAEQLRQVEPSIIAVALDTLVFSYIAAANIAAEAGNTHLTNLCVEVQGLNHDLSRVKCYGSVLKKSRYAAVPFRAAWSNTGFQDERRWGRAQRVPCFDRATDLSYRP